jgi:hypothetical protein
VRTAVGDLTDSEVAISLVLPSAPLGENDSELVPFLGDFKGWVFQQISLHAPAGKAERIEDGHNQE